MPALEPPLTAAASGNEVQRGFCPSCGSPVLINNVTRALCILPASTLDDPSGFRPEMDIFTSHAQAWDRMDPDLPKFPEMPPIEVLNKLLRPPD